MRRGLKIGQTRPTTPSNTLGHEYDWMLEQWKSSSPEVRQQLVLAKIRQEEQMAKEKARQAL